MTKKRLTSWSAAQRDIASIVAKINADPALARAAMTNPIIALQEIGYEIDPSVRREFEERIRFSVDQVAQLHRLQKRISELAGRDIDPNEPADVHSLLFDELRLPRSIGAAKFDTPSSLEYLPSMAWARQPPDALEALRGKHEVVKVLLQYRAIEASEPRFASREFFDAVRAGTVDVRLRSAVVRLRPGAKVPA